MDKGREYWNLKIEETKELFKRRPEWMGNFDNDFPSAAFIKGIISEFKPENILEIGTAAGWAAYYMLEEAHKYSKTATLASIDKSEHIYHSLDKKIGAAFAQTAPELMKFWDLHTKTMLVDYAQNCSRKFEFVFIDACHLQPWAALDLICAMPLLAPGAVVVFHDVFLNKIEKGELPADRHPCAVNGKREKSWGPNCVYEAFKDKMMLSYDDISPNCAAIKLNDITFEGILQALNKTWEKENLHGSECKDLMQTIQKTEKLVKNFWGENEAAEFIAVCEKHIKEDGEKALNFYRKQYEASADYLKKLVKNKKRFCGAQANF